MILLILVLLFIVGNLLIAKQSKQPPKLIGLNEYKKLNACPKSPNCVCSEAHNTKIDPVHFIQPIALTENHWQQIQQHIIKMGGKIEVLKPQYMHAIFVSSIFHYVDDLECRLDVSNQVIHIRSASRLGHSDFGVNKKRIEVLKQLLDDY